ncbi:hypothetical protein FGIG_11798 [Fasciola gigantica]|uniref:Uncharacterized protein n=1 Tax=Fasciola gigantica TaxID=46835 RepID=A0A504Z1N6_FASGI|nr:hypothetical protein FGIG_11798 [Fasciola gigantica]
MFSRESDQVTQNTPVAVFLNNFTLRSYSVHQIAPDRPPPTYNQPQQPPTTTQATAPSAAQPTPGMPATAAASGPMPAAPYGSAWGASPYGYGKFRVHFTPA